MKNKKQKQKQIVKEAVVSKLEFLNFNLKNEILQYLPVNQVINEMFPISKKFAFAVRKKKYVKKIIDEFTELISLADFSNDKLDPLYHKFLQCGESSKTSAQICEYLVIRKIRDEKSLKLKRITLEQPTVFRIFCKSLKNHQKLKSLYINDYPISLEFTLTEMIKDSLLSNTSLIYLDFTNAFLGANPKNFEILQELLIENQTLKKLSLNNNMIGEKIENIKFLAAGLSRNKSIEILNLSNNYLNRSINIWKFY